MLQPSKQCVQLFLKLLVRRMVRLGSDVTEQRIQVLESILGHKLPTLHFYKPQSVSQLAIRKRMLKNEVALPWREKYLDGLIRLNFLLSCQAPPSSSSQPRDKGPHAQT